MQKITFSAFIVGLFFSIIACNLLTVDDAATDYPTTFLAFDFSELEQLNAEYQEANNGQLCSTLNRYGFTGFSEIFFEDGESPCSEDNREVVRIEMDNTDTLVAAAQKALLKNSTYTGVEDTSALVLKEMSPQPGCINCGHPGQYSANIAWKVVFENQRIDSVEVKDTEITVFVDAKGVYGIWGNWYPDLNIPGFVKFGYLEVQQGIIGWEIEMSKYTGERNIYVVQPDDVTEKPQKVHLPVEEADSKLMVRTCWAVPISYSGKGYNGWIAYIDIEEGFLVELAAK